MKVAVIETVERVHRWVGKLFQIVGPAKLKKRRDMLAGEKLVS